MSVLYPFGFPSQRGGKLFKNHKYISGALVAVSGASGGSDFSLLCKTILHTSAESLGVLRKVQPSGIQRRNRSVGEEVPCRPEEESKNRVTERRKKERIAEQILLLLLSLLLCVGRGTTDGESFMSLCTSHPATSHKSMIKMVMLY